MPDTRRPRTPGRPRVSPAARQRGAATASPLPNLLEGEDLPREPRQRRSLDNRARLKSAALKLFAERGYEGTSIDGVAAAAGIAVGGVYLHFRSKRQLLLLLMDDLVRTLAGIDLSLERSRDPRRALRELLARAFSTDLEFLGAYRAWQEAVLTDDGLARKHRALHAWTARRVLAVLQALQSFPGARPGVDLERLAPVIDTFFWALMGQALRVPRTRVDEWLESATHLVFHALFVDPRAKNGRS